MEVVVPDGVAPGQAVQVQTPDGAMLEAVVPQGLRPGDKFLITTEQVPLAAVAPYLGSQPIELTVPKGVNAGQTFVYQGYEVQCPRPFPRGGRFMWTPPVQPGMMPVPTEMEREDPAGAAAARDLAAKMVGNWKIEGRTCPSCFCPLIWVMPQFHTGEHTVHPLNANQQYSLTGFREIWVCPFLGLPIPCCPIAYLKMTGEFSADGTAFTSKYRNINKSEWDPMGKWSSLTGKLTSVDAKTQRATWSFDGRGPLGRISGTREVDGRAMTYTDRAKVGMVCGSGELTLTATKVGAGGNVV